MNTITLERQFTAAAPIPERAASAGATEGGVQALLRLEGAAALAGSVIAYRATGGDWLFFAALFLLPDLSMLGYLINRRVGAPIYNAAHTYLAPAALAVLGWSLGSTALVQGAFIWAGHVGFDRLMGYGLKYARGFGATHLGQRGKA